MNLWDQFLAWLGLTQPTADGTMSNIPQPIPGAMGPQGPPGTPGTIWYNGAGAPSNALGLDGDYYLNDNNGDIYHKAGGSWV